MIASPSDAATEREIARHTIHKWNDLHSENKRMVLLPIAWDTHAAPEMGSPPQKIIDKRILEGADILVGVFLHRLGTPTLDAQSGTAHEIDFHIKGGRPAMIYFLKENVDPAEFDKDQYDKLKLFMEDMKSKGLFHENDRKDFEKVFLDHLTITINTNEYIQRNKTELKISNLDDYNDAYKISNEATQLLVEASKDKHGDILKSRSAGGTAIKTNGKNMIPSQEARIVAKWEHALNELLGNRLIEERGTRGEIFAVTHEGYEYADKLQANK